MFTWVFILSMLPSRQRRLSLLNLHTNTHTHPFSSRWIHTSQLSPLLHPANPDLQPHVCVLQVRPKTVLCWGNHHIQRHPPGHTLSHTHTDGNVLVLLPSGMERPFRHTKNVRTSKQKCSPQRGELAEPSI